MAIGQTGRQAGNQRRANQQVRYLSGQGPDGLSLLDVQLDGSRRPFSHHGLTVQLPEHVHQQQDRDSSSTWHFNISVTSRTFEIVAQFHQTRERAYLDSPVSTCRYRFDLNRSIYIEDADEKIISV